MRRELLKCLIWSVIIIIFTYLSNLGIKLLMLFVDVFFFPLKYYDYFANLFNWRNEDSQLLSETGIHTKSWTWVIQQTCRWFVVLGSVRYTIHQISLKSYIVHSRIGAFINFTQLYRFQQAYHLIAPTKKVAEGNMK